ncbi:hypothetical protein UFOVP690_7 [uncultured Caudovirales phage]|uniref:Uncharacterized protein n=1 Tax=uncultured Caudovirales phage TaxID=2100421 RepID=A0A6J5NHD5_9CAUD|nr:hypothetical protein UFOVP690_7 [uncultured Caudovirales phage]
MQTVIKELIDELNELSNDYYKLSEYDTCHGIGIAVEFIITKLEKEKQQIIQAHFEGWSDAYNYLKDDFSAPRRAEDYYEETYEIE